MKRTIVLALLLIPAGVAVAMQCAPPQQAPAKHSDPRADSTGYDVAAMYKMHLNQVTPEFATAAQPTVGILEELKAKGTKVVINLRPRHEHNAAEEEAAAKRLGLRYFNIPVEYRDPKFEQVDEFLKLTDDPANKPALIHCTMNIRAGTFWAIRRVLRDGWKWEDAEKEAQRGASIAEHLRKFAQDYIAARTKAAGKAPAK